MGYVLIYYLHQSKELTFDSTFAFFYLQQGYKSTMTFLRYFAAKEEIAKNDESLRERIRSLSNTVEDDVEEQDENDDDIMEDMNVEDEKDDVIKGKDEVDANSNTSNSKSIYSMKILIFLNAEQIEKILHFI